MTETTLLVGGRVLAGGRYTEALLVEDGTVVAAGPQAAVRPLAATGADRIDLGGALLVPGLADAHLHLGELARERSAFDARPTRSLPELTEQLRSWAETHPHGPLAGRGLDPEALSERRWPTVQELDAAVADRPLVLTHSSGHAAALNSAALDRTYGLGPSRVGQGPAPHVLVEDELADIRSIVDEALPVTPEAVEAAAWQLAHLGLTSVGTMNTGPEELRVLRTLSEAGGLPIRVRAYLSPRAGAAVTGSGRPDDGGFFRVVGVKWFLDGAFGPRTASLDGPYADDPATRGLDRGEDAELATAIDEARQRGLMPALHAIGDRAVSRAARLLSGGASPGPRGRIEHAGLTPSALLPRLRDLGVPLVVQPSFLWSDYWLRQRLGAARARWAYAFRTLADLGILLAGSSDAPFDQPDPWQSLRAAVRRADPRGRSANPSPDQALTEPEALALYTDGAHRAIGDDAGGSLAPGSPADFLILSVRRLGEAVAADQSPVRETWVAGRPLA